jgi:hypothetical protein
MVQRAGCSLAGSGSPLETLNLSNSLRLSGLRVRVWQGLYSVVLTTPTGPSRYSSLYNSGIFTTLGIALGTFLRGIFERLARFEGLSLPFWKLELLIVT